MRRYRDYFLIVLLCLLLQSCVVLGKNKDYHPFDTGKLDGLLPGRTTAPEVTQVLGAPSEIVKLSNGNAYIYRRSVSKGTGVWLILVSFGNYDEHYDQIVMFFDNNDVMTHFGVTLDTHQAAYGFPF